MIMNALETRKDKVWLLQQLHDWFAQALKSETDSAIACN